MKIYLAGPITGVENYKENFKKAEKALLAKGHFVMNPAVLPDGFEHSEYMRICLSMIDVCEAVLLLAGWEKSKGALLEVLHASRTGKVVCEHIEEILKMGRGIQTWDHEDKAKPTSYACLQT